MLAHHTKINTNQKIGSWVAVQVHNIPTVCNDATVITGQYMSHHSCELTQISSGRQCSLLTDICISYCTVTQNWSTTPYLACGPSLV